MKKNIQLFAIVSFALALVLPLGANAEDQNLNMINLQAQSQGKVEPDILTVNLQATAKRETALEANEVTNKAVKDFLANVKREPGVEVVVSKHHTYPITTDDKHSIDSWVSTVSVALKGKDKELISKLVSGAPKSITSNGSYFSVSPELASRFQSKLMNEAIAEFQSKAYSVTKQFGFNCYDVVNLHVNDGQVNVRPMQRAGDMMFMTSDAAANKTQPSYEGGEQDLRVSISGNIQMFEARNQKCWVNYL